jgi:alkylation response protein AidB-like acyl-CoA dehydrogenase
VENGVVKVPSEFSEAYQLFVESGWQGLDGSQDYDGMGLPALIGSATFEMWATANLALSLCPMLTSGAIDTVELHASDELKQRYLPKMVSGEWSATMDLTEPQAGSDLAKVRVQNLRRDLTLRKSGCKPCLMATITGSKAPRSSLRGAITRWLRM